jgi:hypothetical protein
MSYKIDSKKLESCAIELFSESSWIDYANAGKFDPKGGFDIRFVTTDGQLIIFPLNLFQRQAMSIFPGDSKLINEAIWMALYSSMGIKKRIISSRYGGVEIPKVTDQKNFLNRPGVERGGGLDAYRVINGETDHSVFMSHENMLLWSLGLYLDRYHKKDILKPNGEAQIRVIKNILVFQGFEKMSFEVYSRITGSCRLAGITLKELDISNEKISILQFDNQDLNLEVYHPLTDAQKRVIEDIIAMNKINKIYIDDHTPKLLVKKQLGQQSIVAKFHR